MKTIEIILLLVSWWLAVGLVVSICLGISNIRLRKRHGIPWSCMVKFKSGKTSDKVLLVLVFIFDTLLTIIFWPIAILVHRAAQLCTLEDAGKHIPCGGESIF